MDERGLPVIYFREGPIADKKVYIAFDAKEMHFEALMSHIPAYFQKRQQFWCKGCDTLSQDALSHR
jgi:hypothetical protein